MAAHQDESPRNQDGVPLPPLELRSGGEHFVQDADYVRLAVRDVVTLQEVGGLDAGSRVLDWGCGAGRLAVGLHLAGADFASYLGVDVQAPDVDWANEHLATDRMRFVRVDAPNERYNPAGTAGHDLPAERGSVDVFFAYSVFSHLAADDTARYLDSLAEVLSPSGRAVVTAFTEPDVQAWQENPEGYGPIAWDGPLHCVRYDEDFFADLAAASGLGMLQVRYGGETDGQSLLVLAHARPDAGATPDADLP